MGTKNNPGTYDCYENAEPDEPMFILLGRDKGAAFLVDLWATAREKLGEDSAKVEEARQCANAMRDYLIETGKAPLVVMIEDVEDVKFRLNSHPKQEEQDNGE